MLSPFDADQRPPVEPPAKLDPDQAAYWSIVAEQWHPDDEARTRILVGMLARADQSTVAPAIRERLVLKAERALAEHVPDDAGHCVVCTAKHNGFLIPHPCWQVLIARRIAPSASATRDPESRGGSGEPQRGVWAADTTRYSR